MNEQTHPPKFDKDAVLRDILAVMQKHGLPVQSVALNISMSDEDFDEQIPYLQTYKAGYYHKPTVIDDVPMLFRAQRRMPFDTIIEWLREHIRPVLDNAVSGFEKMYPAYTFALTDITHQRPESDDSRQYVLGLKCVLDENSDDPVGYNVLDFTIVVNQMYLTDYPKINALIGWLVDEESGEAWGIDVVFQPLYWEREVAQHVLQQLEESLPECMRRFKLELDKDT